MIHPFAGVLSRPIGMGLADLRTLREATVERPLAEAAADLAARAAALASEAEAALWAQNVPLLRVETVASLLVKYAGTDTPLRVALGDAAAVREAFEALHQRRFGFVSPGTALVVEALAVEAIGHADAGEAPDLGLGADSKPEPLAILTVRMAGAEHATPVFERAALPIGGEVAGPAIVREATGTTLIEPGWRATVDRHLNLIVDRVAALAPRQAAGTRADPVMLEVFNNLFMADRRGRWVSPLQNTAYSVNMKERLDFLLRHLRSPRQPDRQRAAHSGPSGIDERQRAGDAMAGCTTAGAMLPGDAYVLNAALQRRHPPAGHHRGDCRCIDAMAPGRCSMSPRAATMATSAASRRVRCRRTVAPSRRRGCCSTTSRSSRAGRVPANRWCANCSPRAGGRARNIDQNIGGPDRAVGGLRARRR
jgi:5-oxoprolinase (ATP-hydrolysing)